LPIARAILCHRCHLSAEIETASCARSTTIGMSPFTAHALPRRDAGAQTEHMHPQFGTRRRRWQGSSRDRVASSRCPRWVMR
jgi:hypothetical protein